MDLVELAPPPGFYRPLREGGEGGGVGRNGPFAEAGHDDLLRMGGVTVGKSKPAARLCDGPPAEGGAQ